MRMMKSSVLGIALLISSLPATGQIDEKYRENQKKAFAASSSAECQSSLKFCNEVLRVIPDQPRMHYLAARLNEKLGNHDIALKHLKRAAKLGYTSKIRWFEIHQMNDPVFGQLREKKEFQEIYEIMKISDKPVHKSQIAFIIKDKKFHTEGITYDPFEKMFYLGGAFRIIKVDQGGNSIEFTQEGHQDGLGWVNGIHIDAVRRTLWACSNKTGRNEIYKYNLSSGILIKKYTLPPDGASHMFNDLVIKANGDVYISDTDGSAIFIIPHSSDTLELFMKDKAFTALNGITLSEDNQVIFTADGNLGIYKIDIKSKSFVRLTHERSFNNFGIDGLYFADNYLYAIQNELLTKISRFKLNKDATHLESCQVFEKNTDDLRAPTTGVIVDGYFYFIADAQGKGSKRQGVIVMKASLKYTD